MVRETLRMRWKARAQPQSVHRHLNQRFPRLAQGYMPIAPKTNSAESDRPSLPN